MWWNTLYTGVAVKKLDRGRHRLLGDPLAPVPAGARALNFHGRYPIIRFHGNGALRPLREQGGAEE
ncbi:hypothetical protein [Streptomyces luteireticuli]|uniref:hypothetical protein n=1 Tax=Streptomyces luteireticuli TaxID=173858 RepID=UPI003557FD01